jgi:hypothetical protein
VDGSREDCLGQRIFGGPWLQDYASNELEMKQTKKKNRCIFLSMKNIERLT